MTVRNAIQSSTSLVAVALLCGSLLACAADSKPNPHPTNPTNPGGSGGSGGSGGMRNIRNPTPIPHTKPNGAVSAGMKSTITPQDGSVKLPVPGDEAEVFSWEQKDASGNVAQCQGAFVGASFAILCEPYRDKCEDGSALQADLIMAYDDSDHEGLIAIVGSDLCGSDTDIWACELDAAGEVGDCVVGKFNADGAVELPE